MSGSVFVSASGAARRQRAVRFLCDVPATAELLIVGHSRGAADDLARECARVRPATFGIHRFSLTQLAARLAALRLAACGLTPATGLGTQAVAARAAFEAARDGGLTYFAPVASMPGFPPALARTLTDLRMAAASSEALRPAGESGPDLATLFEAAGRQFETGGGADRASLFTAAQGALSDGRAFCRGCVVVLFDVAVETAVDRAFMRALLAQSAGWLALVPAGDESACAALDGLGATLERDAEAADGSLAALRRHLFTSEQPPRRERDGEVTFFSAPGEGREAAEIARYVLDEARRGVRFDEMAVLLRSPGEYLGLVEHAFARAGVPAWLGRGTRRPHPAGRALLALLACADENLSAHRFAEYLSLAQVPAPQPESPRAPRRAAGSRTGSAPAPRTSGLPADRGPGQPSLFDSGPVRPVDDALATGAERVAHGDIEPPEPDVVDGAALVPAVLFESDGSPGGSGASAGPGAPAPAGADAAVLHGTVRAPYRWEAWLNESAVIAGRDRWKRLDGLAAEYRLKLREARRSDPGSSRTAAIERDLEHLDHLRAFALPLIDEFAGWPESATWREWLDLLEGLVPRVLRQPLAVQRVLAELRPMGAIGPVRLREVREVLSDRLRTVSVEPPDNRYGRVFVGTTEQARGRVFRVVFVPGLAERVFPQKLREDPLLADSMRVQVSDALRTREVRVLEERLLLRVAIGAATERAYLSYPRLELREARPRVPSFYGLDVLRAITGRVPGHEELQADAARETKTTLAWPAPEQPSRAIDDLEHDLAVLAPLLSSRNPAAVQGRARYLLDLNPHLRRSLTERWQRWKPAWTAADGIVKASDVVRAALAGQRLGARPYSLTALQRYASCPYQFLLQAIYRLEPFVEPTPLQRLDPLTKGGLFHAIQAAFFRERQQAGALPITHATLGESLAALDRAVAAVADREREALAPAVDRVWRDEVASIRGDLRRWVMLQAEAGDGWRPERFELSFGLELDADHDPHSVRDPVTVDGRFVLRGSIDLVERQDGSGRLRVTDHKTGRNRTGVTTTIAGGRMLQPVLYSLVVEQMTGESVSAGRLYYCTAAGDFTEHVVTLDPIARRTGIQALEIVDRAVELGFLAASPDAGACTYCEYHAVCGPGEEKRAARKNRGAVADLASLRGLP